MGKNLKIKKFKQEKYRFPILPWSLESQALSHPPLDWPYPHCLFNQGSKTPRPSFSQRENYANHPQSSTHALGPVSRSFTWLPVVTLKSARLASHPLVRLVLQGSPPPQYSAVPPLASPGVWGICKSQDGETYLNNG